MQEHRKLPVILKSPANLFCGLCSHVNNIYNKLAEIQQQLPHSAQHMNTGDVIQIEAPDFDPNIDEVLPIPVDQNTNHEEIQGSANSIQQFSKKTATTGTPASSQQDVQDVDWLDAIPVEILPQPDQDIKQNTPTVPTQYETDQIEIPQLETNPEEEEQSQDLQTYLIHHNTYKESQNICKEYRARLLELNDDRYYQEIDRAYQTYGPWSLPYHTGAYANIWQGERSGTQGGASWTSTLWSKNKIIAKQNPAKD